MCIAHLSFFSVCFLYHISVLLKFKLHILSWPCIVVMSDCWYLFTLSFFNVCAWQEIKSLLLPDLQLHYAHTTVQFNLSFAR
jgi:hypothetical protein